MELQSRVVAKVEQLPAAGDIGPGVPSPSTAATEGCGEIVPVGAVSHSFTEELVTGASLSHPDAAGLKGASLRAPSSS